MVEWLDEFRSGLTCENLRAWFELVQHTFCSPIVKLIGLSSKSVTPFSASTRRGRKVQLDWFIPTILIVMVAGVDDELVEIWPLVRRGEKLI